jgi:hypothetical protein
MAEIITALISHLTNTPDVFSVFGNRITSKGIPDNQAYPCAYMFLVTGPRTYTHDKNVTRTITVQIDVFDDDQSRLDTSTELIRNALSGHSGQIGSMTAGYVFVNDGPGEWNAEDRNYRNILEVTIGTND